MGRLIIESKAACKGKEAMIGRDEIFRYVRKKYNVAEDYPLPTAPTFPVMRHPDTRKWFAIIMDVPKDKLGLFEDISYIMAKHADPQGVPDTPDEWLDQFGTFSIYQVLPEIIELWGLNVQTQVESRKTSSD